MGVTVSDGEAVLAEGGGGDPKKQEDAQRLKKSIVLEGYLVNED